MSNVTGSFSVSNGPKFEFISTNESVAVSGYKNCTLVGSGTLNSSNTSVTLMSSTGIGDYSASVSLSIDSAATTMTLTYSVTYSGQQGTSTKTGTLGIWNYTSGE